MFQHSRGENGFYQFRYSKLPILQELQQHVSDMFIITVCTCLDVVACERTSGHQKRKAETESSPRKRQRSDTGIARSPYLPTPQLCDELVFGVEQAADSRSPAYHSFASTPSSTIHSQSIDSNTSITAESQKSSTVGRSHYEEFDQHAVSTHVSKRLHVIAGINEWDQGLPIWMRLPQSHQRNTRSLLSLICAVGALPKLVLERALSPQERWNEYGVKYQIEPRDAQLEPHLKVLFSDSDVLWQVLQHLVSTAAVCVEKFNDMEEVYFCGSISAEHIDGQERTYWVEQALWLFCYVFPRNPTTL